MGCSALSGETIGMHPSHTPSIIHPLSHNIIYMYHVRMYTHKGKDWCTRVVGTNTCLYAIIYFSTHPHIHACTLYIHALIHNHTFQHTHTHTYTHRLLVLTMEDT